MTEATLFVGGRVYTGRRYAEALLAEEGRVVAVGAEAAVRRQAPTGAERVDLAGGLLLPGLADAHLHLGELTRARRTVDVRQCTSIPQVLELLRDAAALGAAAGVVAQGLDIERLAEGRWPTATELDAVASNRPVVLFHVSSHAAVGNSVTVARAHDGGLPSPPPGRPEGLLLEEELARVYAIVDEAVPPSAAGLAETVQGLARLGLTAVGTMNTGPAELAALGELDAAGRLPLRVQAYPPLAGRWEETYAAPARPSGRLRVVGVKAFLDGAFGPRTAALEAPYTDDPSVTGIDRGDEAPLTERLRAAVGAGLSPALHAIGDRAVRRAARLLAELPVGVPRRIEHASLTPPSVIPELERSRATLVVQPSFVESDHWLGARLGDARARWAYAFRTLADRGIPLAGSSDAPCETPDPWAGMRAAVARQDPWGRSANPRTDEALTETEAFGLYTSGAAVALRLEETGELVPGARADAVVVAAPRISEALRLGVAGVRGTWVDGCAVPATRAESGL